MRNRLRFTIMCLLVAFWGWLTVSEIPASQESPAELAVAPEPPAKQPSEPSPESTETSVPAKPRPTQAECEQMKLLIVDGKVDEIAAMLDKGFDFDACIGEKGTVLHYAAGAGQEAIVELLLKRGADLGVRDDKNATPLHIAAANKNVEICCLFLDAGANVNITGCNGRDGSDRTPLHIATAVGACDVVKLLIARGANVNALDSHKRTPLCWAIYTGQSETADILIEHGGVMDPSKIPAGTSSPEATASEAPPAP